MNCSSCGAPVTAGSGRFCSHCGTALAAPPPITSDEYRTHPERFAAVEKHPHYAAAVASPPKISALGEILVPVVFIAFGIAFAGLVTSDFILEDDDFPIPMMIFFGVFMVVWFTVFGKALQSGLRFRKARVIPTIAVVVDERVNVSTTGVGKDRSTSTSYYATLQFRDGSRLELPTGSDIAGQIIPGDAGVAFCKGGQLVGYHRIAV